MHEEKYAGENVSSKINKIKELVKEKGADGILICSLDSIAWILNMRGNDIEFTPLFLSYLLISWNPNGKSIINLYANHNKFESELVKKHLIMNNISLSPYEQIFTDISQITYKLLVDKMETNYKLFSRISTNITNITATTNPIHKLKMIKNKVELEGFRASHIRDGLSLVRYLSWLEQEIVINKRIITEYEGALKLKEFRALGDKYISLSFKTISASGANAAIIHYTPSLVDSRILNKSEIYLVDSGAQYLDGTTDVTRSVHMGNPTYREREMYTRVLMGVLDVQLAVFPKGMKYPSGLDYIARGWLYKGGVDFKHATGHGVGHFLNVHQGWDGIYIYIYIYRS